jgi:hypothetical protein
MLNRSEPACLVIADITGYTSYLAGVELDHAQDILADLIDTVVGRSLPRRIGRFVAGPFVVRVTVATARPRHGGPTCSTSC